MTGLLKNTMHDRAAQLDAPVLDLGEITAAGERQIRRRRTGVAAGLVAASVVAALAGAALLPDRGQPVEASETVQTADGAAAAALPLGWVTGRTLHVVGAEPVELSAVVRAWVWVGDDILYTDETRQVHLWRDGSDSIVGHTTETGREEPELVADGRRAAWVDPRQSLTLYDIASGEMRTAPRIGSAVTARVTAIDDATVYAVDDEGVLIWNSEKGHLKVIDAKPTNIVMDAKRGVVIRRSAVGNYAILTRDGTTLQFPSAEGAYLSPDTLLISTDNHDEGQILDATTGARKAFNHGYWWARGYQWLDDTSLAVLAFDGTDDQNLGHALLLTCDGLTGACDTPGLQIPGGMGDFQLPIGIHLAG